jgi:hypothetical protein
MNYERFPSPITNIELTCALRFDGYLYIEETDQQFPQLNEPIVDSQRMHEDPLKNFAVFFALQRFLHKWGGERLTKYSSEHHAYDLLYLHLYKIETPPEYAHPRDARRWDAIEADKREDAAQYIRNSLCRKGTGEMFFL